MAIRIDITEGLSGLVRLDGCSEGSSGLLGQWADPRGGVSGGLRVRGLRNWLFSGIRSKGHEPATRVVRCCWGSMD